MEGIQEHWKEFQQYAYLAIHIVGGGEGALFCMHIILLHVVSQTDGTESQILS